LLGQGTAHSLEAEGEQARACASSMAEGEEEEEGEIVGDARTPVVVRFIACLGSCQLPAEAVCKRLALKGLLCAGRPSSRCRCQKAQEAEEACGRRRSS